MKESFQNRMIKRYRSFKPMFEPGGRFSALRSVYEGMESFLTAQSDAQHLVGSSGAPVVPSFGTVSRAVECVEVNRLEDVRVPTHG